MNAAEFAQALRTLPDASKQRGSIPGPCWNHCKGRVLWPAKPHGQIVVRCDSEWNPHVGVMDGES